MTAPASPPYGCLHCATAGSLKGDVSRMPRTCPTRTHAGLAHDPAPYLEPARHDLMVAADATPFAEDGRLRTRVEELIAYARGRGVARVGVAFCVSLLAEAQALARQLEAGGLEAALVCCRVGAVDHDEIGLPKAHPDRFAAICNPVAQARLLNEAEVGLVAQVGLCIGHDLILQETCHAPVTTLVVKDRALDHHPVRALRPEPAGARPVHVDDETFLDEVLRSPLPVVLEVWSPGCAPCQQLEPVLRELAGTFQGRLRVADLDAAESLEMAARLGIMGTPTVLHFQGGREVRRLAAPVTPAALRTFAAAAVPGAAG